jgi:2-dehydro-3-deoxy-D-arabinonate dehydratase
VSVKTPQLFASGFSAMMSAMRLCRFKHHDQKVRLGLVSEDSTLLDLTAVGLAEMSPLLEADDPTAELQQLAKKNPRRLSLSEVQLLAPVERQEVWAAGVTYQRSKAARMEESEFSANAYDRVYAAQRPEIFFKSLAEKVVATGEPVGIRRDAKWSVPEPELVLVLNSRGKIVGYTIGNDMSSRDIEGENLLYLPQAKTYHRSCALGPWIVLGASEASAREWKIKIEISRDGKTVFTGDTAVGQIKRRFDELAEFLFRCQVFPHGVALLTGTGIVPPDHFTLNEHDAVRIEISGIGVLQNNVTVV